MSFSKNDQVFQSGDGASNEAYIALAIANALRKDYGELGSAVKRIGRRIGANPRAIRNWYEARNAPNSMHLLLLAQASPEVFQAILILLGRSDILELMETDKLAAEKVANLPILETHGEEYFTINVKINAALRCQLNHRQLWFLGLLQDGQNIRAAQIASIWGVTLRTARADIAPLIEQKLVRFRGTKKGGKYKVL